MSERRDHLAPPGGRRGSGRNGRKSVDRRGAQPHGPPRTRTPGSEAQLEVGYRLRWAKRGGARFLSHLDALRALVRALRRAELPLALSQGYNPHLKIAFASALALGVESEAEFVDVQLTKPLSLPELARRVAAALPPGFLLREARFVPAGGRALAAYESISRYVGRPIFGSGPAPGPGLAPEQGPGAGPQPEGAPPDELAQRARWFLAQLAVVVERSPGRTVDVRSLVADVRCPPPSDSGPTGTPAAPGALDGARFSAEIGDGWAIEFDLLSGPKGAGRADELLFALGQDPAGWLLLKTDFWPLVEGMKISPWQA
ncbi:MAG: TIGR03936 family radical SAM-associated protein [Bacillota bacterium]|nr:TIGR03936 family radical SAM-associated protein [Bacillota bacterium]